MSGTKGGAGAEWQKYWTLVLGAALGYSVGIIHTYSLGPFVQPLQDTFGWSRAQITSGITISGVLGAPLSLVVGVLVDRFGPRPVGLIGMLLMAASFALLGTATGDTGNWVLLWCGVALGNVGVQTTIWTTAVASRFSASRGLALAVTMSGASLGTAILPLLAATLIEAYGWRVAFMGIAGIWILFTYPFVLLFFRGAHDVGRLSRADRKAASALLAGLTVREGFRTLSYYKLLLASFLFAFIAIGLVVHFVPMLMNKGVNPLAAAGVASLVGLSAIVGRLGGGFLLDRLPGNIVGGVTFCLPIIACFLLYFDGVSSASQIAAAICFGLTVGAEVDVIAYLASRHLGLKNFGTLFGVINGSLVLGVAFGPLAGGAAFDHFGGYTQFLVLAMVCMLVGSLAIFSLPKPRYAVGEAAH